ncbi:MAG: adenosylcobinamide-phosphate synthase CbiB [Acidimicrobiales bacterium]
MALRVARRVVWPLGAAAGLVADRWLGEPPASWHPVVGFGAVMGALERALYRDRRAPGVAYALVGLGIGLGVGRLVRSAALATTVAVGGRALRDAARQVDAALSAGDLEVARTRLVSLVGRETQGLAASEIARAVVESVAENTVDAIVAPALWAAWCGPAGALGYRAVNTMDAMVGHHSTRYENYGWASARLDDLANWLPARATAMLVALVRPPAHRAVREAVRRQAPAHPSPNAGVAEAAFAAALGRRLGGRNRYGEREEVRPILGWGPDAQSSDIARSVRLSRDVAGALAGLLVVAGLAQWWWTS